VPERVLVTGASGFVGGRLLPRLLAEGFDVHAVSRAPRRDDRVRWHEADLADPDATRRLILDASPDVVYHLASRVTGSREPQEVLPTLEANLASAVGVLLGALEHGSRRVVLTGSMEEVGGGAAPGSPYAAAKLAASGYARMFHAVYGLSVVNLRVFMVYGPDQPDTSKLVPYTITSLLGGKAPELGAGTRPVDWVYVDDVVDALVAAASSRLGDDGAPIDIGSGELRTIRELVEEIARRIESTERPRFGARGDRSHEATFAADLAPARRLLGWEPRTPLAAGLDATIESYASRATRGGRSEATSGRAR
jgi:nucleoside-diphosphate-sugar epimerase